VAAPAEPAAAPIPTTATGKPNPFFQPQAAASAASKGSDAFGFLNPLTPSGFGAPAKASVPAAAPPSNSNSLLDF